jgi:hypothetical protein
MRLWSHVTTAAAMMQHAFFMVVHHPFDGLKTHMLINTVLDHVAQFWVWRAVDIVSAEPRV